MHWCKTSASPTSQWCRDTLHVCVWSNNRKSFKKYIYIFSYYSWTQYHTYRAVQWRESQYFIFTIFCLKTFLPFYRFAHEYPLHKVYHKVKHSIQWNNKILVWPLKICLEIDVSVKEIKTQHKKMILPSSAHRKCKPMSNRSCVMTSIRSYRNLSQADL